MSDNDDQSNIEMILKALEYDQSLRTKFWTVAKVPKQSTMLGTLLTKVAGKSVSISEASIRSDLLFDDADGKGLI
ncbi:hypothetical protein Tco_1247123 [Tanacetum coccineum]